MESRKEKCTAQIHTVVRAELGTMFPENSMRDGISLLPCLKLNKNKVELPVWSTVNGCDSSFSEQSQV